MATDAADRGGAVVDAASTATLRAAYQSTRELLRVRDLDEAVDVLTELVHNLGGTTSRRAKPPQRLDIDLSLGRGAPLYAVSDDPAVRAQLCAVLPDVTAD